MELSNQIDNLTCLMGFSLDLSIELIWRGWGRGQVQVQVQIQIQTQTQTQVQTQGQVRLRRRFGSRFSFPPLPETIKKRLSRHDACSTSFLFEETRLCRPVLVLQTRSRRWVSADVYLRSPFEGMSATLQYRSP